MLAKRRIVDSGRTPAASRGAAMQLFLTAFQSVADPRAENTRHDLAEILIIALVPFCAGLNQLLPDGGVRALGGSSFSSVSSSCDTAFLRTTRSPPCFACSIRRRSMPRSDRWGRGWSRPLQKGGVIAIDGKSLKGAYDKGCAPTSSHDDGLFCLSRNGPAPDAGHGGRRGRGNEVDAALEGAGPHRPQRT